MKNILITSILLFTTTCFADNKPDIVIEVTPIDHYLSTWSFDGTVAHVVGFTITEDMWTDKKLQMAFPLM